LQSVKLPMKIIAITSSGNKHYAWFIPSRKIIKKVKEKLNGRNT